MSAGFHQAAAEAQRQRDGTGGLVRASHGGPAEKKAGCGGVTEKLQGAGEGPESQPGSSKRRHTQTGGTKILSGETDHPYGDREGGENSTSQGRTRLKRDADLQNVVTPRPVILFVQETVEKLQETLRELKLEFEVQKNFKTNLEQLTEGLKTELTFLRYIYFYLFSFI